MSEVEALDLLRRIEQYQRELASATQDKRAKTAFIEQISQDMRLPLNAIMGYAQLLKRESVVSTDKLGDALTVIERSGEELMKRVDNLLEFVRAEASGVPLPGSAGETNSVQAEDAAEGDSSVATSRAEIEGYAGDARSVLIADSDVGNRDLLTQQLESVGFVVHAVGNGFDALHWVRGSRPNLIITELAMPVIDGPELVRILRAGPESRETPIIGISSDASDQSRRQALAAGCAAFLTKPLLLPTLLVEVGKQLHLTWRRRIGVAEQ